MILFSSNLKFLRESSGKKQGELASFLGVKANTISNYEQGISEPDFVLLEKIIEYFNISGYDLLFEDVKLGKSRNLKSDSGFMNEDPNQRIIRAQDETIETQRKFIFRVEDENKYLRKQIEELKPGESGQKRKVG